MSKITDLSAVIKEADAELLAKKREALRERAKPVLRHKERMEESIAECEKDLARAKEQLAEFSAALGVVEATGDTETFEKLEKEVRESTLHVYVPHRRLDWDHVRTGYVSTGLPALLNLWDSAATVTLNTTDNA